MRKHDPDETYWQSERIVLPGSKQAGARMKPDLVYDNGIVGGVWELKPGYSASALSAAPEAKGYAQLLNLLRGTNIYAAGTQNGAPAPPFLAAGMVAFTPAMDPKTGKFFAFYMPDPSTGAIYWLPYFPPPLKEPVGYPIHEPKLYPIPISEPAPAYDFKRDAPESNPFPPLDPETIILLIILGILFGKQPGPVGT